MVVHVEPERTEQERRHVGLFRRRQKPGRALVFTHASSRQWRSP